MISPWETSGGLKLETRLERTDHKTEYLRSVEDRESRTLDKGVKSQLDQRGRDATSDL